MISILMAMIFTFKPMHMIFEPNTCGAAKRFMKERVVLVLEDDKVRTGSIVWESEHKSNGYYLATYKADPEAYMSMSIMFDGFDAYMTIQGIDAKRKPCRDTVYMRYVRK